MGKQSFIVHKSFYMSTGSKCKQVTEGQDFGVEFLFREFS